MKHTDMNNVIFIPFASQEHAIHMINTNKSNTPTPKNTSRVGEKKKYPIQQNQASNSDTIRSRHNLESLHLINPRLERIHCVPEPQEPVLLALVHTIQMLKLHPKHRVCEPPVSHLLQSRLREPILPHNLIPHLLIIASSSENFFSSPSYPTHSISNCSASAVHSCFHLKTSPLLQLNASFLA